MLINSKEIDPITIKIKDRRCSHRRVAQRVISAGSTDDISSPIKLIISTSPAENLSSNLFPRVGMSPKRSKSWPETRVCCWRSFGTSRKYQSTTHYGFLLILSKMIYHFHCPLLTRKWRKPYQWLNLGNSSVFQPLLASGDSSTE